jgi:hypothetical protein
MFHDVSRQGRCWVVHCADLLAYIYIIMPKGYINILQDEGICTFHLIYIYNLHHIRTIIYPYIHNV